MDFALARLLQEKAPNRFQLIGASVLSGLANAAILMVIGTAAEKSAEGLNFRYLGLFLCFTLTYVLTKKYVLDETSRIAQAAVCEFRVRISDRLRDSYLVNFERVPRSKIVTALVENTESVIQGAYQFAKVIPSLVMILASLGYIAVISQMAFVMAFVAFTLMIIISQIMNRAMASEHAKVMVKGSEFLGSLEQILHGFKELKVNRAKSDDLYKQHVSRLALEAKDLNIGTEKELTKIELTMFGVFYTLFGCVVFALPQLTELAPERVVVITTILCFVVGNFEIVIQGLPKIIKADIALNFLYQVERDIGDVEKTPVPSKVSTEFASLVLDNVGFSYLDDESQRTFAIGPISLKLEQGDILLIKGGNGSGKSTLMKIIAGLYYADYGTIALNDKVVTLTSLAAYRELFSPLFTDFHLFDRLYGLDALTDDDVMPLLEKFKIRDKTSYFDGKFTNLKLSTGQRKRLALVAALLDRRPILLLDEFSADQDPTFKAYFYRQLLPEFQAQGKTIIAVTHDDRYLDCATQVVTMDYGKITTSAPPKAARI